MSDMWQVPEGLAESLLKKDPCADARNDAWANGVDAGMAYIASMMMDLIKELRDDRLILDEVMWPEDILPILDKAEQRLKKVFDE